MKSVKVYKPIKPMDFIIINRKQVIEVYNKGLSQKDTYEALKHLEGCPPLNTLKTYLKPAAELMRAYENRINKVELKSGQKDAEITRLRNDLAGVQRMYEDIRVESNELEQANKELTRELKQARQAGKGYLKERDKTVGKLETRIKELEQALESEREKPVIHKVTHDDDTPVNAAPKNFGGWTLNKRKVNKDGALLYNLAKRIDGKLRVKYLGVWDPDKAQGIINELNQELGLIDSEGERAAFRAAYDAVGNGRSFVRIHRIRQHLSWPREQFDRVLAELKRDYTIQLQGGDPSIMTDKELQDSFMDEKGRLRLTVTWRE